MNESTLLKPGVPIKPKVSEVDVKDILSEVYGLKCVFIEKLNGYDDSNYHVTVEQTCRNEYINVVNVDGYVLKIINTLESKKPQFFEAQDEVLIYLSKKGICCPKPVLNRNGKYYTIKNFTSGVHLVRLLEFINGSILHQVPSSNDLFYQTGQFVARVDEALAEFYHPVYDNHKSIWMLDSLLELEQFVFAVEDNSRRKTIEDVIKEFFQKISPVSSQLKKGMIHGDFNDQNILVERKGNNWNVKGILDFGDSHLGCYVYELAITMTYMIIQGKSIDAGAHVLAGYTSVRKLSDQEYSVLKICVAARLCQSLVMGAYSILQDPENSYILTTASAGWALLEELWTQPEDKLLERWRRIELETG